LASRFPVIGVNVWRVWNSPLANNIILRQYQFTAVKPK